MKRLKYVSRVSNGLDHEDIEDLVAQAERNNLKKDITGILMSAGGLFFQVIEGPDDAIDELYAKLMDDPRHGDVLVIGFETGVKERIFPDWSLGKLDLDKEADLRLESLRELLEAILKQRELIEQLTGALERAVWRELVQVA